MKRCMALALAFLMTVTAAGCAAGVGVSAGPGAQNAVTYPDPIAYDDYEAQFARRDKNPVTEQTIEALNAFAYRSAAALLDNTNSNYSPASLYYALAVLALGASGTTAEEINTLLGTEDPAALAVQLGNLMRLIDQENEAQTLHIANSLWLRDGVAFDKLFLDTAAKQLYASVFSVDMQDPKTAELMKQWMSDNTGGKIERNFELDPALVLSIMNTVYFKGAWMNEFNESETTELPFHTADGQAVTVPFLGSVSNEGRYLRGEDYCAVRLYFAGGGYLLCVLPDEGVNLAKLCGDPAALGRVLGGADVEEDMAELTLHLPKFKLQSSFRLLPALERLGVSAAQDAERADFSAMTQEKIYVTGATQDTYIAVDEKGVEAAAVTVIDEAGAALLPELPKVELTFDRPFLYGLYTDSGVPLFLGAVGNPAA